MPDNTYGIAIDQRTTGTLDLAELPAVETETDEPPVEGPAVRNDYCSIDRDDSTVADYDRPIVDESTVPGCTGAAGFAAGYRAALDERRKSWRVGPKSELVESEASSDWTQDATERWRDYDVEGGV